LSLIVDYLTSSQKFVLATETKN